MKTLSETRILIYILYSIEWIVSHVKEGNKIVWIVLISEFEVAVEESFTLGDDRKCLRTSIFPHPLLIFLSS